MYKELDLFPEEDEEEQKDEGSKVDLNPLFDRLSKSKFRSSFYLNKKDKEYIHEKGWTKIEQGAREITAKRLAPAYIPERRKTDSEVSWHISAIHSATCHRSAVAATVF